MIAHLELDGPERVRHDADLVFVGAERDDGAALLEHLLENDDVALNFVARRLHHVEPFVQYQFLAGLERVGLDGGVQIHLHLAPLRQHIDGRVLVDREVDPVRGRRRAQLVDFFLQRGDLLPRLVERIHELLVLVAEVSLGFLCLDVTLSDAVELLHGSFPPWSEAWLLDSTNLLLLF